MPTQIENVQLYDVEEVATVINKHPNTVRDHIHKDKIKAKKINGGWYVSRSTLEDIVEDLNFPDSIIEHRLGITSPKSGKNLATAEQ